VAAGFRDSVRFSNAEGSRSTSSRRPHAHKTMSFLAMDPPRHTRMRALVARVHATGRRLEPRIREIAIEYLDAARDAESFDISATSPAACRWTSSAR
jgi:cytochrome P450